MVGCGGGGGGVRGRGNGAAAADRVSWPALHTARAVLCSPGETEDCMHIIATEDWKLIKSNIFIDTFLAQFVVQIK